MDQQTAQGAGEALGQLGSVGGLIGVTTAATHVSKAILKGWPVPPMAFVFGELVTFAVWRAGFLHLQGLEPIGATFWQWIIVGMWGLTVVLGAMGASTVIDKPSTALKRGTGS